MPMGPSQHLAQKRESADPHLRLERKKGTYMYRTNLVFFTDFVHQSSRSRCYMDTELVAVSNLQYKSWRIIHFPHPSLQYNENTKVGTMQKFPHKVKVA